MIKKHKILNEDMNEAQAEERFRNVKIDFEYLIKEKEKKIGPIKRCPECGNLMASPEGACSPCETCGKFDGCS